MVQLLVKKHVEIVKGGECYVKFMIFSRLIVKSECFLNKMIDFRSRNLDSVFEQKNSFNVNLEKVDRGRSFVKFYLEKDDRGRFGLKVLSCKSRRGRFC